jgi:hypothetical protein
MTMEAQRVACRDALNMASTGRLKNVDYKDDDRKERLKKLIRDNVRPVQVRSAFDVVAMLAPLDTERLKLIADIFVAMRPGAAAEDESVTPSEEVESPEILVPAVWVADALQMCERGLGKLSSQYRRAKELSEERKDSSSFSEIESSNTMAYLCDWRAALLNEVKARESSPRRRRRRRKRPSKLNVVAFAPRASTQGDGGPKAAS